jgi:hypothetical protein
MKSVVTASVEILIENTSLTISSMCATLILVLYINDVMILSVEITDPIENGDIFPEIYLDDKIVC